MFISIQNSIFRAAKLQRIFYKSIEYITFFPNVPKSYRENKQNDRESTKANNEEFSSAIKRALEKRTFCQKYSPSKAYPSFQSLICHKQKKKCIHHAIQRYTIKTHRVIEEGTYPKFGSPVKVRRLSIMASSASM